MICTPFRVSLVVIAIFALGFQIAGIFVRGWIRQGLEVNLDGYVQDQTLNFGMWSVSVCYGLRSWFSECDVFPKSADFLTADEENEFYFFTLKILTIVGSGIGLVGAVLMVVYFYYLDVHYSCKSGAILSSLCWFVSACVCIGAVAITLHKYFNMLKLSEFMEEQAVHDAIDSRMETYFPWAFVLTAIGAFLSFVNGTLLLLRMYKASRTYS